MTDQDRQQPAQDGIADAVAAVAAPQRAVVKLNLASGSYVALDLPVTASDFDLIEIAAALPQLRAKLAEARNPAPRLTVVHGALPRLSY